MCVSPQGSRALALSARRAPVLPGRPTAPRVLSSQALARRWRLGRRSRARRARRRGPRRWRSSSVAPSSPSTPTGPGRRDSGRPVGAWGAAAAETRTGGAGEPAGPSAALSVAPAALVAPKRPRKTSLPQRRAPPPAHPPQPLAFLTAPSRASCPSEPRGREREGA